jgi:hypothetical protein
MLCSEQIVFFLTRLDHIFVLNLCTSDVSSVINLKSMAQLPMFEFLAVTLRVT